MRPKTMVILAAAASLCFSASDTALAKDNPGKAKGHKVHTGKKPGKGPKTVPPGQIKRYTRGAKLPSNLDYLDITDLSNWNLGKPGRGNRYIRVGDDVLEVTEDLSTVVEAVGIVGDLLK